VQQWQQLRQEALLFWQEEAALADQQLMRSCIMQKLWEACHTTSLQARSWLQSWGA
jgi:hypothetical protein